MLNLQGKKKYNYDAEAELTFALAEIGLSLNDFLELTPAQTLDVRQKYIEKENQLSRERWELARWHVLKTKADIKGRGGYITLYDIARFPWEQPAETEKSTEEKFRKAVARYN